MDNIIDWIDLLKLFYIIITIIIIPFIKCALINRVANWHAGNCNVYTDVTLQQNKCYVENFAIFQMLGANFYLFRIVSLRCPAIHAATTSITNIITSYGGALVPNRQTDRIFTYKIDLRQQKKLLRQHYKLSMNAII